MLSEAKHPATSNAKTVRPKLWSRFGSSWVLRFAQNDKTLTGLRSRFLGHANEFSVKSFVAPR